MVEATGNSHVAAPVRTFVCEGTDCSDGPVLVRTFMVKGQATWTRRDRSLEQASVRTSVRGTGSLPGAALVRTSSWKGQAAAAYVA